MASEGTAGRIPRVVLIVALVVLAVPAVLLPIDLVRQMRASVWFRDHEPGPVSATRIIAETQSCTCPDWRVVEGVEQLAVPEGFVPPPDNPRLLFNAAGEQLLTDEFDIVGAHPYADFWDVQSGYGTYVFEGEVVEIGRPEFAEPTRPMRRVFRVDRFYPLDRDEFDVWTTYEGVRVLWGWVMWGLILLALTVVGTKLNLDYRSRQFPLNSP